MNKIHDTGVARHIGAYSDAIEVPAGARFLITSGTPGLDSEGRLPPDFESQARNTWINIVHALAKADMSVADLVKVTTSLTSASDVPAYVPIRTEFLGEVRPAFMLQIVDQLIWPEVKIEVEIMAAKRDG